MQAGDRQGWVRRLCGCWWWADGTCSTRAVHPPPWLHSHLWRRVGCVHRPIVSMRWLRTRGGESLQTLFNEHSTEPPVLQDIVIVKGDAPDPLAEKGALLSAKTTPPGGATPTRKKKKVSAAPPLCVMCFWLRGKSPRDRLKLSRLLESSLAFFIPRSRTHATSFGLPAKDPDSRHLLASRRRKRRSRRRRRTRAATAKWVGVSDARAWCCVGCQKGVFHSPHERMHPSSLQHCGGTSQ